MRLNNSALIAFYLLLSMSQTVHSQDSTGVPYPFLFHVELRCNVQADDNSGISYYYYDLVNGYKNPGEIESFLVDISRLANSIEYDTLGLRFNSTYEENTFRAEFPGKSASVVPVGFPRLPAYWTATLANAPVAWFSTDTLFLSPGTTLKGFVMMSRGLPTARRFVAEPYFNVYEYFPSLEDTTATMSVEQMDSIRNAVNYHGWTIGPTAPPLNFSATSWIDTLTSYKHQCVTLGWLNNGQLHEQDEQDDKADEGIVERLDRRLDKAKDALTRSDSVKARLELALFVQEVEQLYGKEDKGERSKEKGKEVLTSEGYALLKYNAEYLIDRLPEKHGRGDEGEHRGKK